MVAATLPPFLPRFPYMRMSHKIFCVLSQECLLTESVIHLTEPSEPLEPGLFLIEFKLLLQI
jgi:hypothetical protein